ncbi:MAG: dockerin type I domain-containing protein, partial [Pirellulales bacterium]
PKVGGGGAATEVSWTLSAPIGTDAILLDLENQRLHDVAGNPLDGEWTEASSTYPSGNGASGGDFRFSFRVLPGDINQDGVVDALDRRIVRERQFTSSTHAEYLAAADADRNGHINIVDLVRVRNQTGQSAPALSPPAAAPLAAIAESSRVPLALPALSNLKSPILHARPRAVDQLLADSDVVSRELTARRRR